MKRFGCRSFRARAAVTAVEVACAVALGLALGSGFGCGPAPEPVLNLYVARHGQTDWNAERRLQGQTDTQLNDTGRAQAARLAERLRGVRLDQVYSSTLARSRETAEIARDGARLESLDGLREQALGKFEGLRSNADSTGAAEFDRRSADPNDALDGGESENAFYERVRATIESILARHRSGTVLVVGHGGTNRMLLRALLGLSAAQADSIRQANDEVYKLEIAPGRPPQLFKAIGAGKLGEL
jgi:probable phosphoglycerate mutase